MPSFSTLVGSAALLLTVVPGSVLGAVLKREQIVPMPTSPPGGNQEHEFEPQFGCNILGVTEYFSREYPVPEECQDYYSTQVVDFCKEFLAVEKTVYTATVTPEATQTSTVVVTTTVKPPGGKRDISPRAVANSGDDGDEDNTGTPEGCRDLTQDDSFTSHPEFMVDTACRCIPIKPYTTIYHVATAPAPVTTVTSTSTVTATP